MDESRNHVLGLPDVLAATEPEGHEQDLSIMTWLLAPPDQRPISTRNTSAPTTTATGCANMFFSASRYEMPNVGAPNFVLEGVGGGWVIGALTLGAMASL